MRTSAFVLWAACAVYFLGCQQSPSSPKLEVVGADSYSLGGRAIEAANAVEVQNPYAFDVKILWQDQEAYIPPHSALLIHFEGAQRPGPLQVFKQNVATTQPVTQPVFTRLKALDYEMIAPPSTGGTWVYRIR